MTDFLNTGVTGLLAFQRALATTSHNITNANTPGYNRQQAMLAARVSGAVGAVSVGRGTEVTGVRRVYDQYLGAQVQSNTSALSRLDAFHSLSAQVDDLLADGGAGVGATLQQFFNTLDALADDPASMITRESFLGQARALTQRFEQADTRLNALDRDVNNRLANAASEINAIAASIAQLNRQIVAGSVDGQAPIDLLDQRDTLITDLNRHVKVATVPQDDGALNVFIGNGLVLVRGGSSETLETTQNRYEPARSDVRFTGGPNVTSRLSGGTIGGALDFRREVLDPTRNALGRLANGIAQTMNAQHRAGVDLRGNLGGDLFSVGAPVANASALNAGSAVVNVAIDDISALGTRDYLLSFEAGAWSLRYADNDAPVAMSGSGTPADPFRVEGIAIEVGAGASDGDSYLLRPNGNAAAGLELAVQGPAEVAAAAAIVAARSATNAGEAKISVGEVVDSSDPGLLSPQTITFIDAATYTIGAAGPFAYTSGAPVDFNGWRVEISGVPAAGDTFTVTPTSAGAADNRNALSLSGLQSRGVLDGGASSLSDSFGTLASSVGTVTHHAEINRDAQQTLLANAEEARLAVSGVNLDEEAANLLRYEQAYQAAAQVISVADQLFQTLIGAVQR